MNSAGGIYWRAAPDWNTAEATPGNGFYTGTTITVHCYQSGVANVPGSSDSMWELASWAGGPGSGSGWVNEHFVDDGSPIDQPSPGVPPCSGPSPQPPGLPAGEFYVQNATGGIYWRSAPDWNAAEATAGNGFYPGTVIKIICYQAGAANVPGSADSMWEQASWVSGPGTGSGWVNEHFVNDGSAINQPSPGAPPCSGNAGGSPQSGSGSPAGGTGSLPGASLFFLPKGFDGARTIATLSINYWTWRGNNCTLNRSLPLEPVHNHRVDTLAGWSLGRLGPIYYLQAALAAGTADQISYVLLIDPGDDTNFAGCDANMSPNPGEILRRWLSTTPNAHLVVIAAQSTNHDHQGGLWRRYLGALTHKQRTQQLLVCNEGNLPHGAAEAQYGAPNGQNNAYITRHKFICPYGVPTEPVS
jgi:hypothetical protein